MTNTSCFMVKNLRSKEFYLQTARNCHFEGRDNFSGSAMLYSPKSPWVYFVQAGDLSSDDFSKGLKNIMADEWIPNVEFLSLISSYATQFQSLCAGVAQYDSGAEFFITLSDGTAADYLFYGSDDPHYNEMGEGVESKAPSPSHAHLWSQVFSNPDVLPTLLQKSEALSFLDRPPPLPAYWKPLSGSLRWFWTSASTIHPESAMICGCTMNCDKLMNSFLYENTSGNHMVPTRVLFL